jgi:hypothetical protein
MNDLNQMQDYFDFIVSLDRETLYRLVSGWMPFGRLIKRDLRDEAIRRFVDDDPAMRAHFEKWKVYRNF